MTPGEFCSWLQGYVDLTSSNHHPNEDQWEIIKSRLQEVNAKNQALHSSQNLGFYGLGLNSQYQRQGLQGRSETQ